VIPGRFEGGTTFTAAPGFEVKFTLDPIRPVMPSRRAPALTAGRASRSTTCFEKAMLL